MKEEFIQLVESYRLLADDIGLFTVNDSMGAYVTYRDNGFFCSMGNIGIQKVDDQVTVHKFGWGHSYQGEIVVSNGFWATSYMVLDYKLVLLRS